VSRLRTEHGFTLIELLVAMAMSTVVFGATLSVLDVFQRNNVVDQQRNEVQDNARNAMDQIARQLRNVAAPNAGSPGALLTTKNYSMIFDTIDSSSGYAWGVNKSHTMMVRYCLNNSNSENEVLWMQVKRWKTETGPPETPSPTTCPDLTGYWASNGQESNRQLVQHVTNRIGGQVRPMFKYSAATAPQTASVEIDMFLDLTPGHAHPGETQLTSGIGLRNANRPPIAAFTVTRNNEYVRLDGSASYDPDGLALTYKWAIDGVPLASTAQVTEVKEKEVASHTYELEVMDPGNLAEKKTETVTL
jgi:prepilin-type N-terminal cleavage/methylation domain-containing protein